MAHRWALAGCSRFVPARPAPRARPSAGPAPPGIGPNPTRGRRGRGRFDPWTFTMDSANQTKFSAGLARQVSSLKLVSRLLAHELHAQQNAKQITLSRDEVVEIQTTIDLFIEQLARKQGVTTPATGPAGRGGEPALLTARHN